MSKLTANNLKNSLWDTLEGLKDNKVQPETGNAIAAQAREILRTIKIQLQIANQGKRSVPLDVLEFSEKEQG